MSQKGRMLRAALAYAKMGWAVFPCRGKIPATEHGLKNASCDPDEIRKRWGRVEHNIGVATGEISGFWVLDVDTSKGKCGDDTLRALEKEHGALPQTVTSLTGGGGQHFLFSVPSGYAWPNNSVGKLGHGLDVRGTGGYIIVPPSNHASRRPYVWEVTSRPIEVAIAAAPSWLMDLIEHVSGKTAATEPIKVTREGGRNSQLASAAGTMRRRGFTEAAILAALRVENADVCDPPLPDAEVAAIAKSVARYAPAAPNITKPVAVPDSTLKLGDDVELARAMIRKLREPDIQIVHDQSAIYRYHAAIGVWEEVRPDVLSRIVHTYSGVPVHKGTNKDGSPKLELLHLSATKIKGTLTVAANEINQDHFFENERKGVAFTNGFVSVSKAGATLEPHSPDNRIRFSLPFAFDPNAKAPRWRDYWHEVFAGDEDAAEKEQTIREFVGACLIGEATRFQKAVVLLGEGAKNGKSQAIQVIRALFPHSATAAVEPQALEKGEYLASLVGVRLNATTELPETDLLETRTLKAVVTGDELTARPLYKNPFSFRPVAGHLFAANSLPATNDMTDGFWRRFIVITFNRRFDGAADEKGLGAKIATSPTEMQGIATWAIQGAVAALQRDEILVPPSSLLAAEEWREHADQIVQFLASEAVWPADEVPPEKGLEEIFERYKDWADKTRHRSISSQTLGRRLKLLKLGERVRLPGMKNAAKLYKVRWSN